MEPTTRMDIEQVVSEAKALGFQPIRRVYLGVGVNNQPVGCGIGCWFGTRHPEEITSGIRLLPTEERPRHLVDLVIYEARREFGDDYYSGLVSGWDRYHASYPARCKRSFMGAEVHWNGDQEDCRVCQGWNDARKLFEAFGMDFVGESVYA